MSEHQVPRNNLPWDPYEAFEQMLRKQFGTTPEEALRRINAELAENPLTRNVKLERRPQQTDEQR